MKIYFSVATVLFIVFISYYALITFTSMGLNAEPFVDTKPIPETGIIPFGYYRIDDDKMAVIPYGYELDLSDMTQKTITPVTNTNYYKDKPIPMIQNTKRLPEGYYQVSAGFMAKLPPGMKPDVKTINASGAMTYNNGFVNDDTYFGKQFPLPVVKKGTTDATFLPVGPLLPDGFYLNDDKTTISPLPYGKMANGASTPGYTDNPNLISANGIFYGKKKEDNKFDVLFHEDQAALREKQTSFSPAIANIPITTKDGEQLILPRESVQGDLTYNEPAKYPYGMRSYVPNYEDSVYLSRTTNMPTVSAYDAAENAMGFCDSLANDPDAIELNCNKLDKNACASTKCCVLLGGSKCVKGDVSGPENKTHYGDIFVRNKDFYYYSGKCYGNCNAATEGARSYADTTPLYDNPVEPDENAPEVSIYDKNSPAVANIPTADDVMYPVYKIGPAPA